MKHSDVQISAEKETSKHVVLHRKSAMELDGYVIAVISWIQLGSFDAMIMVGCGENGMLRMAVSWLAEEHVGSTPSAGPGSSHSAILMIVWRLHQQLALFLD